MENRFGVKDLFLFLLLIVLIIMVALAMKQYDRQYLVLQGIKDRLDNQMSEMGTLHRDVQRLQAGGVARPAIPATAAATQASVDPFIYMKQAEAMPGYTQGDWFINAAPNSDKITPLLSGDTFGYAVQARVLDSLIQMDEKTLDWVPNVAVSWQVQDNTEAYFQYVRARKAKGATDEQIDQDPNVPWPAKVTYQLRPDVTFSDGQPLTADDVVWSFNWTMNPNVEAPRDRAYLNKIKSVTANGDYQVTFTMRKPYFDLLRLTGTIFILPRHFYEKFTPEQFNASTGLLLGSSAYRLENPTGWTPGQTVVLIRNERYWGEPPALDRIVYRVIDNDLARLTAFRNGEIDIYGDPTVYPAQAEPFKKLLGDANVVARTQHFVYDMPSDGYRYIAWNEQRGGKPSVFADKRVRQAMTMLIDRERICRDIWHGYAEPITGPFYPKGKQCDRNIKPWPFDVARAKQLLQEAGFVDDGSGALKTPDGGPFAFKLTYPSGLANYDEIALLLKDTFAKAGITLIPDPLDWSVFSDRMKNRNYEAIR